MKKLKKAILINVLFLILGAVTPSGDVFADTNSKNSDVKSTTTFKISNNITSIDSKNSLYESKAYAPSAGGVSFGGIGFSGTGAAIAGAGGAATGTAIHYIRGRKKRSKKVRSKFRHHHKAAEHKKNRSHAHRQRHTNPRAGQSDKKKRRHGRYR